MRLLLPLVLPLALGLAVSACVSPAGDTKGNEGAPTSTNDSAPKAKTVALGVDGMT